MLKSRLKENKKTNCFQCQGEVIVKYNYPLKNWTLINNWRYWTERKEDEDKYICNLCLQNLYYKNKKEYWKTITNPSKRMRMRNHIYSLTK